MNLVRIIDSDDWVVDYNKDDQTYRVSYFEDSHFVDELCFKEYKEKECLLRCKDCDLKYYSESNNLWCSIFNTIMPEDGYCCFGETYKKLDKIEIYSEIIDRFNDIPHTSFWLTSEELKRLLDEQETTQKEQKEK